MIIKGLRTIATFGKEKSDPMVLEMKIIPVYSGNKITRLNIFVENDYKELTNMAYYLIEYTGNYPTKMSMRILGPFEDMQNIEEIEYMQNYFVWNNGNIIGEYQKLLSVGKYGFITTDSVTYEYDNKLNAFSCIKDINPLIGAEESSTNNITSCKKFGLNENNELEQYHIKTITYQYNTDNYSTIATETTTYTKEYEWTKVTKYEYKQ